MNIQNEITPRLADYPDALTVDGSHRYPSRQPENGVRADQRRAHQSR